MTALHKASRKQEARIAKRFDGKVTPGSGNQWSRKNDVRSATTSFEMKYTGKSQYALKASELELGEKNALLDGRDFVFGIEMNSRNWIILDENDYVTLLGFKQDIERLRRCSTCSKEDLNMDDYVTLLEASDGTQE